MDKFKEAVGEPPIAPRPSNFESWKRGRMDEAHIPRWLFRSWSPGSNGLNSPSLFISPAAENGKRALEWHALNKAQRKFNVEAHARWWNADNDILISFTSSLIFALQHGIYKIANPRDPHDAPSNDFLTVIDTRGIESAFAPIVDLLKECELDERSHKSLSHEWYTHEFVAQNYLVHVNNSVSFSFRELADAGMFRVFNDLQDEDSFSVLASRVIKLSTDWHENCWLMTDTERSLVEHLTRDLSPGWRFALTLNILAMKRRSASDIHMSSLLQQLLTGRVTFSDQRAHLVADCLTEAGEQHFEDTFDPKLVPCAGMRCVYRIMNILRELKAGTTGRKKLLEIQHEDLAATAEDALAWLVTSAGERFDPCSSAKQPEELETKNEASAQDEPQQRSKSAQATIEEGSATPARRSLAADLSSSFLPTPGPSRSNSVNASIDRPTCSVEQSKMRSGELRI